MPLMRTPEGAVVDVPLDQAQRAIDVGYKPVTSAQAAPALTQPEGNDSAILAGTTGLLSGATLGLSDAAIAALGTQGDVQAVREARASHPVVAGAADLAGAIAPAFLTGGASLPAGAAGRIGAGIAEDLGGGILARTAGGAAEGAIFGTGQGVSELALSQDPLTVERAASTLTSNALFGAGFGGLAGAGSALVERGLQRAGKAIDEGLAARAAQDAVPEDLATLDAKGLRTARDAEIEKLSTAEAAQRTADRSAVVDDVVAYRGVVEDANPWAAITEGQDAARLTKASRALRNALDDAKGLRDNPGALAKPLRVEEKALENAIANRAEIAQKLEAVNESIAKDLEEELAASAAAPAQTSAPAPQTWREFQASKMAEYMKSEGGHAGAMKRLAKEWAEIKAGGTVPSAAPPAASAEAIELTGKAARRYASFADVRVPKSGTVSVARDEAQAFLDALKAGKVTGEGQQALGKLDGLLEQNRALQERIKAATAPLTPKTELASDRLTAIDAARDALAAPKPPPSIAQQALSGTAFGAITSAARAIPIIGQIPGAAHFIGAKGAELVTRLVSGSLGEALGAPSKRAASAAQAFLDVAGKASPAAPVLATKVLAQIRYAPSRKDEEQPSTLHELYTKRTDEIKQLTEYDETGVPRMRAAAREQLAAKLQPIGVVDPVLADHLESLAARRIAYLSSIMPRRPDVAGMQVGPDHWHPSDIEMRSWARSAAAVEDPHGVLERALHGQVTPEDVGAMQAVYPEILRDWTEQVAAALPTLRATLPYHRRLALSMLTGEAVDPALDPHVLALLQGQFPAEPGSAGGTQAPRGAPQFGSIKKLAHDSLTPAQERRAS